MKDLERLYEILSTIEKEGTSQARIEEAKGLVSPLAHHPESMISRLSQAESTLKVDMSYKSLMCFLVPIERHLKKRTTDTEILVEKEDRSESVQKKELIVVLDNIRSSFNFGAALRTCEALGVKEVLSTGYSPNKSLASVQKTSMGTWSKVEQKEFRDLTEVKAYTDSLGYKLCMVETASKAQNIYNVKLDLKTALVFGNERFGIAPHDLELSHAIVKLPVFGLKNSLNVNAALTAACYEWVRQNEVT